MSRCDEVESGRARSLGGRQRITTRCPGTAGHSPEDRAQLSAVQTERVALEKVATRTARWMLGTNADLAASHLATVATWGMPSQVTTQLNKRLQQVGA